MSGIKKVYLLVCTTICIFCSYSLSAQKKTLQFIWSSDVHFGLTKTIFRNDSNVSAAKVNAAMVEQMNKIPFMRLPSDNGTGAGNIIGGIEGIIITGDLCNRQETGIQSASISWKQFEEVYITKIRLKKNDSSKSALLLTPGNHDISNAIGFHRPMQPKTDNASMVGIYNLTMHPTNPITSDNYDFEKNKIHYSENFGAVHFIFVSAWPDSSERAWMEQDLKLIPANVPAFIFTHADPYSEARFFQNPNGGHLVNATDKFENLVSESFKDGTSVKDSTIEEQKGLASFLVLHPNIKAYFHGHSNYAEYYEWNGPEKNIHLSCFRSDSPMKGKYSSKDETRLSFNIISIDPQKKELTVRECLWNKNPSIENQNVEWGIMHKISY
jgi:hypothetical protein